MQPVAERGGSDQALLRLVRSLPRREFDFHIAVPGPSPLAEEFAAAGATLHEVPMLRISTSHDAGGLAPLRGPMAGHRAAPGATGAPVAGRRRALELVAHLVRVGGGRGSCDVRTWSHAREIVVQSRLALGVERALCRWFAERVIAVSYAVGAQLDPANVVVLDEYLDPAEFAPSRAGVFRARVGARRRRGRDRCGRPPRPAQGARHARSTPTRWSGPIGPTPSSW